MKYSEKFPTLLGAGFFALTLTNFITTIAHADPAPKSAFGKVNAKPLQGAQPAGEEVLGVPPANPEPDSAQQQGINPSGASSPTAPLMTQNLTDSTNKALKDIDLKAGNWMEFRKKDSQGEIVTVCGAMNHSNSPFRIMFRAAKNGLEIDTMDTTWSLPPQVTGETTFLVGKYQTTFTMTQKNQMTLEASVKPPQLKPLLDALSTEHKAVVIFGAGHRHIINLNGAREILQNFRECTLSHSFADIGGY
ncbi:hypothetical protein FAI41_02035 [Acetobacteraceae bacterium]|nr:hypothetical protein FAI41_02035 [Acetobacteraceae bacterium]